jgi:hypothetical protein
MEPVEEVLLGHRSSSRFSLTISKSAGTARQALKQRLEETCRICAVHGCLDCTCQSGE